MQQNSGLHPLLNVLMLVLAPAAVGKYMGLLAIWVAARLGSQHPEVFGAIVGLVSAVICFVLLFKLLFGAVIVQKVQHGRAMRWLEVIGISDTLLS